ncbi:MAG: hypothetical protein IKL38_00260 [Firmicutes bacterium]|nr:hypothetical protein [Bacillota bacterium]
MGVLFAILGGIIKWILLIILGLIGLILVLLLVVVLTPLRYKIKWTKQADAMEGEARVSWLLHLISFRLTQKGKEIIWTVKIGPKIIAASYPLPKKEKKPKRKKKKTPPQMPEPEPPLEPMERKAEPPMELTAEPPLAEKAESIPQEEITSTEGQKLQIDPTAADEGTSKDESQEEIPAAPEKSLRRRITDVCWKIRRFFERIVGKACGILDAIRAIPTKVRGVLDKWDQVKEVWEGYPQKSETVAAIKLMLGGILKVPLPKKYDVKLRIGMKDPATTGQILMYYYSLAPVLFPKTTRRRRFTLEAEFEEPVIDVTAVCMGRFSIGSFLWPVIRALLNGHIRRLIRYVLSVKKKFSNKEN